MAIGKPITSSVRRPAGAKDRRDHGTHAPVVQPEAEHETHAHEEGRDAREARRQPRAHQPELGRAPVPEHQHPVAERVHEVRDQHHPQHRPHDLAPHQVLAQRAVGQEEGHARDLHAQEALGLARERGVLPEQPQHLLGLRPGQDHEGRHREREHEALLEREPRARAVARAVRLADDRIERHQEAVREQQRPVLPRVRERHRGEGLDRDASRRPPGPRSPCS